MNMKRNAIACIALAAATFLSAANYIKDINNGKYEKTLKKIEKKLVKEPTDIEFIYYKAYLLSTPKSTVKDLKTAYSTLLEAKKYYNIFYTKGETAFLDKEGITFDVFNLRMDTIGMQVLEETSKQNSVENYQAALDYYTEIPQRKAIENKRNAKAYEIALESNTIPALENFIKKYPKANEVALANARIHTLAFHKANETNTPTAYKNFLKTYPNTIYELEAKELHDNALYSQTINPDDRNTYKRFIDESLSQKWKVRAIDSLCVYCRNNWDRDDAKYLFNIGKGTVREIVTDMLFHDIYTDDGTEETIEDFYDKYDSPTFADIKSQDKEIAYEGRYLSSIYDPDEFIKKAAPNDRAFLLVQAMIANDVKSKNWDKAANAVKKYMPYFSKRPDRMIDLLAILEADYDNEIKPMPITGANTDKSEMTPVISADGRNLYFGRQTETLSGEDVYVSKRISNGWGKAAEVKSLSNILSNEDPLAISTDGTEMIIFKNGELTIARKGVYGWYTDPMPDVINQGEWQADATMSSDGNAIIFASKYAGNYHSGSYYENEDANGDYNTDIYVSIKDRNGDWTTPKNLGSIINTKYCDRSPFLHPDMKTLYFASSGHGGLGDLDIYMSKRLSDTCWTCWSKPVNLGKEINSTEKDWGYKVSTDGKTAYFAKYNKTNKNDLYSIKLPNKLRPEMVATISGNLKNRKGEPVSAEIKWEDLSNGENIGTSRSDPEDGRYFIVLPMGKLYGYYVEKDSVFPISSNIDLRNENAAKNVEENIDIVTFEEMKKEGLTVPVNNLFFNTNKFTILSYSKPELQRVAKIIKDNNLSVEISGHTDNIGKESENQELSEKRAMAVKEFLIDEGCSADKLKTIGYGSTKPVADNKTEKGRAKNRRVELKFVE